MYKFEKLEIKPEGNWFRRNVLSRHARKSFIAICTGAVLGVAYFYFTEGQHLTEIVTKDITGSAFFGAFLGFFITNSPCARGRC